MSREPTPESTPEEPDRSRRWLPILGTIAVLAVGGAVAARTLDLGEAVGAIRAADPTLLAGAVAVYAASWPLRGRRYGDLLEPMDRRLGTGFLTSAVLLSQTANLAIPARGGDAVRALLLKRRRAVSYATGVASLAVERVFDLLAIGLLGGLALGTLVLSGDAAPVIDRISVPAVSPAVLAAVGMGVALLAIGVAAIAWCPRSGTVVEVVPETLRTGVRTGTTNLATLARRPRALAAVGIGSLAIWTLDAATAVLVLAAVASPDPLSLLAVGALAVCAGNLAKVLPLTQGGVGLYEGAFAGVVVALSPITGATALAAAVLDHALKNGVTLAGGAFAGLVLHRSRFGERDWKQSHDGPQNRPRDAGETPDSSETGSLLG